MSFNLGELLEDAWFRLTKAPLRIQLMQTVNVTTTLSKRSHRVARVHVCVRPWQRGPRRRLTQRALLTCRLCSRVGCQ